MKIEWTAPLLWTLLLVVMMVATGPWIRRHYRMTSPETTPSVRRFLTLLRILVILALLAAALGPVLVLERERSEPAVVRLLVEDSGSMAMGDGPDGMTRWEAALALAASADSVLDGHHDVVVDRSRGNGIGPLRTWTPDGLPPDAAGTDLTGLLMDSASAGTSRLTVLLTDGHQTVERTAPALVEGDVVVVGMGDPVGPPDVKVRPPRVPEVVQVGDDIVVEIELELGGWGDRPVPEVTVVLENDGREVGRRTLQPAPGDALVRCEIDDTAAEPGLQLLTARVLPVPGEALTANNSASAAVQVREGVRRVLLATSQPGWMVRFLAAAAAMEDQVELAVVKPGATGPTLADGTAWTGAGLDVWDDWDGVIVTDARAASWLGSGLEDAVATGMGSMILPAGTDRPWDGADALWPVDRQGRNRSGRWRPEVAPGEEDHPLLSGLQDLEGSFRTRPPVAVAMVVEPKPGGRVILSMADPDRDESLPLLVVGRHGEGRTAWFAAADLWEQVFWRPPSGLERGDDVPRKLLSNLLVWLAQGNDETGAMILGSRHVYDAGEIIEIRGRSLGLGGRPAAPPAGVDVRPLAEEGEVAPRRWSMRPLSGEAGTSEARLGPLPPGRYELVPLRDDGGRAGPSREIVVTSSSPEDRQGTQKRTALRAFAAGVGGTYVDGGTASGRQALLRRLAEADLQPERLVARSSVLPWAGWPFVLVAVILLALEWILRRRHGLL